MQTQRWTLALVLALGAAWAGGAAATDADDLKAATERANKAAQRVEDMLKNPPNSGEDFTGDRLTLRTTMHGLKRLRDGDDGDEWVAPAGTKVRVLKEDAEKLTLSIENVPCLIEEGEFVDTTKNRLLEFRVDCTQVKADELVRVGEAYTVKKSLVLDHGYRRSGWVYGALLVPYKYHRHDRSFSSAVTIGPYLGYRLDGLGFDTSFIASIGIASLSVPSSGGGTSTLQGYTAAIGIIGSVGKNKSPMQAGVLIGRDWAGSNASVPYVHEGRTWIAAQIGFSFSE